MKLLIIWALTLGCSFAQAVKITQFKGNRMILDVEKSKLSVGQKVQLVDNSGKVVGTMQIISLKGRKALGKVLAGKPTGKEKIVIPGGDSNANSQSVAPAKTSKPAQNVMTKPAEPPAPPAPPAPKIPYRVSALMGLASNTLNLTVSDGIVQQNVDNTGNSINLAVAADRTLWPWLTARALVSYEQFNAIGAATVLGCANQTSRDCETDLKYLSIGGYAKHEKVYKQFIVSAAVGLNGKYLVSKKSTALVESDLGSTVSYGIALGADYLLESKAFIPFVIEKQFFLKSATAEMNTLSIRTGVGKEF